MLKTSKKSLFLLGVLTSIYVVFQVLSLNQAYSEYLPLIYLSFLPLVFVSCKQNRLNIFEPSIILILFCVYGGLLRIFSIAISSETTDHLFQASGNNSLLSGCLLFFVFNFFFAIGYQFAPKIGGSKILRIRIPKVLSYFVLGSMIAIGCYLIHSFFVDFGIYNLILSGNISSKRLLNVNEESTSGSYLRLGETLFLSLFMVSYCKFKLGDKKLLPLVVSTSLLVVIFSIIVSSRSGILTVFIAYATIRNFFENKFISPKIIAGILGLVLVFAFIANSRQSDQDLDFNLGASTSLLFEQLSRPQYSYTIDKAAMVTQMVPSQAPYLLGQSLTAPFVAPVPRAVWSDKPLIRYGPEFADQVLLDPREKTGIPPSFPVELFWNFGWPGICIGALGIGALSGNINRKMNLAFTQLDLEQLWGGSRSASRPKPRVELSSQSTTVTRKPKTQKFSRPDSNSLFADAVSNAVFTLFFVRLFRADFSGAIISYLSMMFFIILFVSVFNPRKAR